MANDTVTNRKALRDYHIVERYEAGLVLKGTEVKSIRAGRANLADAYARIEKGEAMLYGVDIQPYEKASHENHAAKRPRKLLLHRAEIDKLFGLTSIKGYTLPALKLYFKNGRVKVELGVGKGKHAADKRQDLKAKTVKREMQREMSRFNQKGGSRG